MRTVAQSFFALISIELFGVILPPEDWPTLEDCPEDAICCYFGGGADGQS